MATLAAHRGPAAQTYVLRSLHMDPDIESVPVLVCAPYFMLLLYTTLECGGKLRL